MGYGHISIFSCSNTISIFSIRLFSSNFVFNYCEGLFIMEILLLCELSWHYLVIVSAFSMKFTCLNFCDFTPMIFCCWWLVLLLLFILLRIWLMLILRCGDFLWSALVSNFRGRSYWYLQYFGIKNVKIQSTWKLHNHLQRLRYSLPRNLDITQLFTINAGVVITDVDIVVGYYYII